MNSKMQDNHNIIFNKLGNLETGITFLVADAKKKNGYITDLNQRTTANEIEIIKVSNEKSKVIEDMYDFLLESKKEKENRRSFIGRIKENWIMIISTNGFTGFCSLVAWFYWRR